MPPRPPLSARLRTVLLIGFVSLLVTSGWRWLIDNFEKRSITTRSAMSEQAIRNPFLALEYLLRDLGYRVASITGRDKLVHLPDPNDVLVVNNAGPALAPDRQAALESWLGSGGHLVITASRRWNEKTGSSGDRFLDALGVELHELDAKALRELRREDPEHISEVRFAGDTKPVRIGFAHARYLVDRGKRAQSGVAAAGTKDGYHLLQYARGRGLVTVTSDNAFLKNDALGEHDHAYYAAALLGTPGTGRIWLLYDSAVAPLPALIWRHAPGFVISAVVLALAAALAAGLRFGPVREADPAARRDLTQHLDAAARFLWRMRERALLAGAARARVVRAWTSRHPELAKLDQQALAAAIAAASGEAQSAVVQALVLPITDEAGCIVASRTLQRLALKGPVSELHQDRTA